MTTQISSTQATTTQAPGAVPSFAAYDDVAVDADYVYAATNQGLAIAERNSPELGFVLVSPDELPSQAVYAVHVSPVDALWVATAEGLAISSDQGRTFLTADELGWPMSAAREVVVAP